MSAEDDFSLKLANSSGLTDADWAEINRLKRAFLKGGVRGLSTAMTELEKSDPGRALAVWAAFFPHEVREIVLDDMAARGLTEEDLVDLIRKHESPARTQ